MSDKLKVGERVRFVGTGQVEIGIVVHTWHDDFLHTQDCYLALFGNEIPDGKPAEKPYILRYLSSSLERISTEL